MTNKHIVVDKSISLIDLLSSIYRDFSNKKIKQLVKFNHVFVNDSIEHNVNKLLSVGDNVFIKFEEEKEKIDLDIIYEDKDIIVINKPSGLLSISNSKEKDRTAFRLVSDYLKTKDKKNRIFVVHRLDEATSGVLMFAKNQSIQEKLQTNWNDLVKLREYYCIIPEKINNEGIIKSYLTMNHNQIVHSTNDTSKGHLAITKYNVVDYKNNYSLVKVCIDTGRRNQIRVHMSENFKPIVGDLKYGSKLNPINRLCLHASTLSLIDPRSNKVITFETEVPKDMLDLLK